MCRAVPGRLLGIEGDEPLFRTGPVEFGGIVRQVSLAYAPEARVGDYLLVHAGFAIAVIDEAVARRTLASLDELEVEVEELT